jgi:hypothetical protein
LLPTLIDILLLNFIQITNIFKMALDLVIIILKRMVVHNILGLTSFRVGIAVGWDRILIPSNHIILVTGKDKNWDSPAITVITHRISFTDDDASRDSADQGNIASQKDTRTAS